MNFLKEYIQPSAMPVPKVAAVGGAGAAIAAVVTLLALTGVIVPEGLTEHAESAFQAAIVLVTFVQAVLAFAAGYVKKDAKPVTVVQEIKEVAKIQEAADKEGKK